MSEKFDYYEELEVTKTSSGTEIHESYKRLARKHHPDKNPNNKEESEEKFKRVGKAYAVLSDPKLRKKYDLMGHDGVDGSHVDIDPNEIFRNVFNNMGGFGGLFDILGEIGGMSNPFRNENDSYIKSPPKYIPLPLSTQTLYNGKDIKVNYIRKNKCSACNGNGVENESDKVKCDMCKGSGIVRICRQVGPFMQQITRPCECDGGMIIKSGSECKSCKGKKYEEEHMKLVLSIPAGTDSGNEYKFDNKADWNPGYSEAGDLIFVINDTGNDFFRREGCNLLIQRDISLKQALIGFKFRIKHMDGRILEIVSNNIIRPDEIMKVEGEGMPKGPQGNDRGDLIIKFNIIFPSHLDDNRRDYLDQVLPDISLTNLDTELGNKEKTEERKMKPYILSESACRDDSDYDDY